LHEFSEPLGLAWKFGANWGKGLCDIDTPTNSFLLFGVHTSVPILVKSIKKCDLESARRRTHWHTDRRKPIL